VLALLGTEKSRKSPSWMLLVCGGLVGMLLVKGLFAALGPPLCALWLLTTRSDGSPDAPKAQPAWLGLAVAVVAMAGAAAAYEMLHRQATGEPFWSLYVSRQLGVAAAAGESGGELGDAASRKVSNLAWYLGRVLWFAFPWSVALLAAAVRLWLPRQESPRQAEAERSAAGAVAFVAGALLLYVGVFSLFDRRADRYVFPAYYLVGAAGAVAGVRRWPALRRVAERLDRPWVPAAVFLLTFAAHVLAGRLGVPTVKIDP